MASSISSRSVVVALGATIEPYVFANEIDWNAIANSYGEEFRSGYLASVVGVQDYDDEGYYTREPIWFICASTVSDPRSAIAASLLEEETANRKSGNKEDLTFDRQRFYCDDLNVADYLACANLQTLWRNGILLCRRELAEIKHQRIANDLDDYIPGAAASRILGFDLPEEIVDENEDDSDTLWDRYIESRGW